MSENTTPAPAWAKQAGRAGKKAIPAIVVDEQAASASDTVIAVVPKDFNLRISSHEILSLKAGVHNMPREQAEHWYSVANGVKIHNAE